MTTALVGADWQRQRWQAGAALAHSWGSGSYEESSREGRLNANLMGLFPYGRYALNPKLTLWGVVGHGWGRLSLLPEDGEQQSTAIQMSMGAVGLDGLLLDGGGSGLTIRSTADALLLRVNSQETEDLAGIQGEVSRLRLGLEAERPFPLSESGAVLTPSLELALRQDGGDAETGFGLDLAAALLWSDPGKGLEVELSGHTLLSHGDAAFHEKGLAASLAWDPNPSSSLGPSLSLSQSMGASAGSGGNDALLAAANWPELETSTRGSAGEDHQFAARLGYGFLAYRMPCSSPPSWASPSPVTAPPPPWASPCPPTVRREVASPGRWSWRGSTAMATATIQQRSTPLICASLSFFNPSCGSEDPRDMTLPWLGGWGSRNFSWSPDPEKDAPGFAGQPRHRPDASICPRKLINSRDLVEAWLRQALKAGHAGGWGREYPQYSRKVRYRDQDGETVYEAREGSPGSGEYHGYPLQPTREVQGLP